MHILGIETSCDETAAAVYSTRGGLMAHRIHSQAPMHAEHGGVVPELASRDHVRRLPALVAEVLAEAGLRGHDLDGVAYTAGPGLIGALLVGTSFARGLAFALGTEAVPVHHLEGHLLAPFLESEPPAFPFLALLVSGGHTQLIAVRAFGRYELLGESLDDAAGEAFDKVAKMLGLGYPGGPAVERLAAAGDPSRYLFPRPMTDRPGLDFSFSGLKTHTRTAIDAAEEPGAAADIARAFTEAVVDTFAIKVRRALRQTGLRCVVAAGGVVANRALRARLSEVARAAGAQLYVPRPEFCTDNAAMIAYAGHERLRHGVVPAIEGALARWPLVDLGPTPTGAAVSA